MKRQTFWKGSLILMVSAGITKVLGALFKIPLTNLLGGTGMGYFSCAYGLFLPIYALSVTGLSAAVAKLTAQAAAAGRWRDARRIRSTARVLFAGVGLLLTGLIFGTARVFSVYAAGDAQAYLALVMIAPSALLGCVAAVERGYYEGLQNMYPTAVSQAVEAAAKVALGLWMSRWVLENGEELLFLLPKGTTLTAAAAAAAVLGVTGASGVGCLYFAVRNVWGDGIRRQELERSPEPQRFGQTARELLGVMLPVALGSIATNLTTVIDLCTFMRCLGAAQAQHGAAFRERFGAMAAQAAFPAYLYGIFTGMALTVFNLVPSVTNMFGRSALPCAARAWTKGHTAAVRQQVSSVLLAAGLLAIPAGGGLWMVAKPVMEVLYGGSSPEEAALAAAALRSLLPGMVGLCLTAPLFSVLQGIGRADLPVKLMLCGVAVKLAGNLLLLRQAAFAVTGAGIATSACYGVVLVLSLGSLRRQLGGRLGGAVRGLLPVVYAAAMSSTAAYLAMSLLRREAALLQLLGAVASGGFLYGWVLWLTGCTPERLRDTLRMRV